MNIIFFLINNLLRWKVVFRCDYGSVQVELWPIRNQPNQIEWRSFRPTVDWWGSWGRTSWIMRQVVIDSIETNNNRATTKKLPKFCEISPNLVDLCWIFAKKYLDLLDLVVFKSGTSGSSFGEGNSPTNLSTLVSKNNDPL